MLPISRGKTPESRNFEIDMKNMPNGFITPNGVFLSCEYGQHDNMLVELESKDLLKYVGITDIKKENGGCLKIYKYKPLSYYSLKDDFNKKQRDTLMMYLVENGRDREEIEDMLSLVGFVS